MSGTYSKAHPSIPAVVMATQSSFTYLLAGISVTAACKHHVLNSFERPADDVELLSVGVYMAMQSSSQWNSPPLQQQVALTSDFHKTHRTEGTGVCITTAGAHF